MRKNQVRNEPLQQLRHQIWLLSPAALTSGTDRVRKGVRDKEIPTLELHGEDEAHHCNADEHGDIPRYLKCAVHLRRGEEAVTELDVGVCPKLHVHSAFEGVDGSSDVTR
ncbi:MAG: uncharacterized protein KVP18_000577 [Porospora cf. gigantea A]|uniref:uncharacterized protein n=1 Tax=Porospora cf. gigantea A TaxID=2853593 RepID=UPI00355A39DC|nr:MAG: hypothetical protein KVP18_000577 [Porospora cf. gigantea A]